MKTAPPIGTEPKNPDARAVTMTILFLIGPLFVLNVFFALRLIGGAVL